MSAWDAMIAAKVERTTAKMRIWAGSIWKNGLSSGTAASVALPLLARIQAPCPR